MNENFKVSVITPVYNLIANKREETFIQCVQSVAGQTYQEIEHVVVDGASNDGTLELLQRLQRAKKITYYSYPDNGIYQAMNRGIQLSKGKYLLFLNSDDMFIDDNAIRDSIRLIEQTGADYSYGKVILTYGDGRKKKSESRNDIGMILWQMPFAHQTMLISKSLFAGNKYDEGYICGADYKWFLNSVLRGAKGVFLDKEIVEYSLEGESAKLINRRLVDDERVRALFETFSNYSLNLSVDDVRNIYFYHVIPEQVISLLNEIGISIESKNESIEQRLEKQRMDACKNKINLLILSELYKKTIDGKSLSNFFFVKGYKRIAIYGYGYIGQCIHKQLVKEGIDIVYIIDKDDQYVSWQMDIPFYLPDDKLPNVDAVLITPTYYWHEIKQSLKKRLSSPMVSLQDLIDD